MASTRSSSRAKPAAKPAKSGSGKAAPVESSPWRDALAARREELFGIAAIAAGLVLGLGVYLRLAGPLGRAVDDVLAWLVGWGRFLLPAVLIGVGVALVKEGVSQHRVRLVLGWVISAVGLLGFLHLVRGPGRWSTSLDDLGRAGGWLGAVVGEPLAAVIGSWGAGVVFVAVAVAGALIATGTSLMQAGRLVARLYRGLLGPVVAALRSTFGRLSTLSSEQPDSVDDQAVEVYVENDAGNGFVLTAEPAGDAPVLYDAAADELPSEAKPVKKKSKPPTAGHVDKTEQAELDLGPGARKGAWVLPPQRALERSNNAALDMDEVFRRGKVLEESLSAHGVDTRLVGATAGPTVTRYELELGAGVKVARVTSLQRDIAYAMAATDVRILAPIPGKSAIGVEVPNQTRQLVALGDVLYSPEARTATHPLDVAIGKDIAGRGVFLNLATTPHLLIAGATGAGKSSGINCIITSLLMRTTPDQVRLILIDPKQVEMGQYAKLPHLLTQPVTNPKKAANALSWAVREMERRYDLLMEVGFRDITGYNAAFDRGELTAPPSTGLLDDAMPAPTYERLAYIVVVVDELNDLMMVAARDVEESITRIAQKARAVGIHLIVATQRPSVNVITGVIKANVPARMAFAVSSLTDSRVILDQPGAEKLVGKGDMLLLPGNTSVAQRIQGAWVGEEEVRSIVAHWRRQAPEVAYVSGVDSDGPPGADSGHGGGYASSGGDDDDDEALMRQAMELVVRSQLGSTSMLQRKLKVGFARAGRIMDLLEQRGVVGPSEGSKARAVLMTVEELELLLERGA
jgi:S-DNA-T family DNA segregation ATPase FtsK/SpoIIIE